MPTPVAGVEDLVGFGETDRHGVDQAIAVIAPIEAHLAADRRHAKRIAIAADAGNHAGNQCTRLRMFGIAERKRIEAGDRPRAHRENVAQNTADAGRGALVRLDIAWMVVTLHLEHDRKPVADSDDAGVLARSLNHPWRLGRQCAQMNFRRFVRAMLVPHRGENSELGEAWRTAEKLQNALVFLRLESVLGDQFGSDGGLVGDHKRSRFERARHAATLK